MHNRIFTFCYSYRTRARRTPSVKRKPTYYFFISTSAHSFLTAGAAHLGTPRMYRYCVRVPVVGPQQQLCRRNRSGLVSRNFRRKRRRRHRDDRTRDRITRTTAATPSRRLRTLTLLFRRRRKILIKLFWFHWCLNTITSCFCALVHLWPTIGPRLSECL